MKLLAEDTDFDHFQRIGYKGSGSGYGGRGHGDGESGYDGGCYDDDDGYDGYSGGGDGGTGDLTNYKTKKS